MTTQNFKQEVVDWLKANCPDELIGGEPVTFGGTKLKLEGAAKDYFDAMVDRGWTVPHWPVEYGGAGLDPLSSQVLRQAMTEVGAPPALRGMGINMIGPTLLEFGTDEQKARHLPQIARGETFWCQGYSEPGAGSDLASLKTRAEDRGDHFLINGSKIWTSGAQYADWMFCLVRTDTEVPKHDGISFVLFPMDQPGITVKPIDLISGGSEFCECFFDDVRAAKDDLVGEVNRGWSVGKRLLQYERSSLFSGNVNLVPIPEIARRYLPATNGRIDDQGARSQVIDFELDREALELTKKRAMEEFSKGTVPTYATSLFKLVGSELANKRVELIVSLLGTQGLGWSGDTFTEEELTYTQRMLDTRSGMIAGGSSEIQRNIIAKRILGLPD
ncbi:MAG: acyl-CoA dehydrogenase family protein [Pseudomonadota bacterium]